MMMMKLIKRKIEFFKLSFGLVFIGKIYNWKLAGDRLRHMLNKSLKLFLGKYEKLQAILLRHPNLFIKFVYVQKDISFFT